MAIGKVMPLFSCFPGHLRTVLHLLCISGASLAATDLYLPVHTWANLRSGSGKKMQKVDDFHQKVD